MPWNKVADLAVKTGTYTEGGKEKGRYENVGKVIENESGHKMYMLKRSFNPAGVPHKDGGDTIIINVFDIKDEKPHEEKFAAPSRNSKDDIPDDGIPF